jgi:pyruvate/2-oxoglutarate dehydrogenase complex dihydrolipoamide dehydrogenase (E3) component
MSKAINHVTTDRDVPFCTLIDLEFALTGLDETEANTRGIPIAWPKYPCRKVEGEDPL